MADSKVSALTEATAIDDFNDLLHVVDVTGLVDKKMKLSTLIVDENDMASDSAVKVPTQQSVKAYVDANAGGAWPWRMNQEAGTGYSSGVPGWSFSSMASGSTVSQYDIYTFPIFLTEAITVTGYDLFANATDSGKVVRVGIYAATGDDLWNVGALTADLGTVSTTTTGAKSVTGASVVLAAGWHIVAFVTNAAAFSYYVAIGSPTVSRTQIFGNTGLGSNMRWWYDYGASPDYAADGLPSSLTGSSQGAAAFEAANQATRIPVSLRYTV